MIVVAFNEDVILFALIGHDSFTFFGPVNREFMLRFWTENFLRFFASPINIIIENLLRFVFFPD